MVVQVNGKVRAKIKVAADVDNNHLNHRGSDSVYSAEYKYLIER